MKKLLTVCAACMVAGMVSAQVESQNIVGYDTVAITNNFNPLVANFVDVGDVVGGITLADLDASGLPTGTQVQMINTAGSVDTICNYVAGVGWFYSLGGTGPADALVIPEGKGFLIKYNLTTSTTMLSGEVKTDAEVVTYAAAGLYLSGNYKAYDITLGDVVCSATGTQVQFINNSGTVTAICNYVLGVGWFYSFGGSGPAGALVLPSSSGFVVKTAAPSVTVTLPAL